MLPQLAESRFTQFFRIRNRERCESEMDSLVHRLCQDTELEMSTQRQRNLRVAANAVKSEQHFAGQNNHWGAMYIKTKDQGETEYRCLQLYCRALQMKFGLAEGMAQQTQPFSQADMLGVLDALAMDIDHVIWANIMSTDDTRHNQAIVDKTREIMEEVRLDISATGESAAKKPRLYDDGSRFAAKLRL